MTFFALIFKNLVRQRIRTGLTVLGISLGITTVVALGVVTNSFKKSAGEIIKLGEADFMVVQEGAADLSFSIVSQEDAAKLAEEPDVASAEGMLFHITRVGSNDFFFMIGRGAEGLAANPPEMLEGEVWGPGATTDVILGERAAGDLDAAVGDTVEMEDVPFRVTGIYRTGRFWEDGGAYAPLETVQEIAGRTGVVTAVYIKVTDGADADAVAKAIDEEFESLTTVSTVEEYGRVDQGVDFLDAANLAISVLAVGIGAIGVMNTMIMSVLERTREIGILRAVGWSGNRILRMIVGESLILCVFAAGFGAALGILATRALLLIDTLRNLFEPEYNVDIFVRALVIAVFVALLGAIYPAIRAVRLTPMEALRHE
jgi:putative ABC transport system permease protein